MTKRELKRAIRRNMTTATQHLDAAYRLALYADNTVTPLSIFNPIVAAKGALRRACQACQPWWKNA